MKKAQNIGISLQTEIIAEIVLGITIAVFFVIAANQFTDGAVANKLFFAENGAEMIRTVRVLPYSLIMTYKSEFNHKFTADEVFVSEGINDPTMASAKYLPFDKDLGSSPKNPIIHKFGNDIFVGNKVKRRSTDFLRSSKRNKVDNIYFVYDDDTKEFVNSMQHEKMEKSRSTSLSNNDLNIIFRVSNNSGVYYNSDLDLVNKLRNYEFGKLISARLFQKKITDKLLFVKPINELGGITNAIIIELSKADYSIATNQIIYNAVGEFYDR